MAGSSTRATQALERAGVHFERHQYAVSGDDGTSYGESVAAALGISPDRTFKTLIAVLDGTPAMAIVPVSRQLSLKALARAAGGRRAQMATTKDAERLTGYLVGGISPFGGRRVLAAYIDETAAAFETIFVSGGRRGMQIEVAPDDLVRAAGAVSAPLTN